MDEELVKRKLGLLAEYINDIEEVGDIAPEKFSRDKVTRRYLERTLHMAIEACLDIGHHLIAEYGWREPVSNRDLIKVLVENGVLNEDRSDSFQKMAQFRNLLVHDYARVDPAILQNIIRNNIGDLHGFVESIVTMLSLAGE